MAFRQTTTTGGITTSSAPVTAAPLTIAAISANNSLTVLRVIARIWDGTNDNRFETRYQGDVAGDPVRAFTAAAGAGANASSTAAYSATTWNHVTGVFASAASRTVYLDGGNNATNTTSRTPTGVNAVEIIPGIGTGVNTDVAEVGIWDATLTADEIVSLSKGFKPFRVRPQSLVFYSPLVREVVDLSKAITLTRTGLSIIDHPRVY
jgi:hypothetical protein